MQISTGRGAGTAALNGSFERAIPASNLAGVDQDVIMLLFDTELRPSPIHGIGVFLLEDVSAGETVWRFDSRIDRVYAEEELASLPARVRSFLRTYSTWNETAKLWVLCGDNGRHFNHSDTPNTLSRGIAFGDDVAAVDLPVGTELTSDYRTICDTFRADDSMLTFEPASAQAA